MESSLVKSTEEAAGQEGVVAVVCADNDGFPVQVRGNVPSQAAGVITQMCELAKQLDMRSTPTIQLETEKLNVFISKKDMATVAVYKQKE